MRKILILGSGAGGTIVANMLRKELAENEWHITIIDRDEQHHYQPGYLFIPFGVYSRNDVLKPKKEFIPPGVEFVWDTIVTIDREARQVTTAKGSYDYDWLILATGADIAPEEIDGMMDGWRKDIFDYYTLEGAEALRKELKYFTDGKIVLNIAEIPYKCPIAPLEFVFMADWFFTVNGVRDKVDIHLVTPLDNVFTKPVAAKALAEVAVQKKIRVTPLFDLAQVNAGEKNHRIPQRRKNRLRSAGGHPPQHGRQVPHRFRSQRSRGIRPHGQPHLENGKQQPDICHRRHHQRANIQSRFRSPLHGLYRGGKLGPGDRRPPAPCHLRRPRHLLFGQRIRKSDSARLQLQSRAPAG